MCLRADGRKFEKPLPNVVFTFSLCVQGTSYRYMEPMLAEEVAKAHDTNHFFLFRACAPGDDISRSKSFSAEFTSGFRCYEGSMSYVKELKNVSLRAYANL